jgi:hypothetical protein
MVKLGFTLAHAAAAADVAVGLADGAAVVTIEHATSAVPRIIVGTRITS